MVGLRCARAAGAKARERAGPEQERRVAEGMADTLCSLPLIGLEARKRRRKLALALRQLAQHSRLHCKLPNAIGIGIGH